MLIVNFSHPLTDANIDEIAVLAGTRPSGVVDVSSAIDPMMPLLPQIEKVIDQAGLTPKQWQTEALIMNLPSLNYGAAVMLAVLHGRMGYFPTVLRLRPDHSSIPMRFCVVEIMDLQAVRESSRLARR